MTKNLYCDRKLKEVCLDREFSIATELICLDKTHLSRGQPRPVVRVQRLVACAGLPYGSRQKNTLSQHYLGKPYRDIKSSVAAGVFHPWEKHYRDRGVPPWEKHCLDTRRPLLRPKPSRVSNPVATLKFYRDIGLTNLYRDRESLCCDPNRPDGFVVRARHAVVRMHVCSAHLGWVLLLTLGPYHDTVNPIAHKTRGTLPRQSFLYCDKRHKMGSSPL